MDFQALISQNFSSSSSPTPTYSTQENATRRVLERENDEEDEDDEERDLPILDFPLICLKSPCVCVLFHREEERQRGMRET